MSDKINLEIILRANITEDQSRAKTLIGVYFIVLNLPLTYIDLMKAPPDDTLEKFIHDQGMVRASVLLATHLVEEMRQTLEAYDLATILVGRSMIGALLMAAHLKQGENVGVYYHGDGPLGTIFAEGDHSGSARAYTPSPKVQLPLKDNKLDFSGAIGSGLFNVVRGTSTSSSLHKGTVQIQTGEVGDDIAYYLYQSQQIPSLVALSVELNKDGSVQSAGGVLIELMPGASSGIIENIENRVISKIKLKDLILSKAYPQEILKEYMGGISMEKLPHSVKIQYQCRCSYERAKNALFLLGYNELDSLIKDIQSGKQELKCDFCGRLYTLTIDEIKDLRDKAFRNTLN